MARTLTPDEQAYDLNFTEHDTNSYSLSIFIKPASGYSLISPIVAAGTFSYDEQLSTGALDFGFGSSTQIKFTALPPFESAILNLKKGDKIDSLGISMSGQDVAPGQNYLQFGTRFIIDEAKHLIEPERIEFTAVSNYSKLLETDVTAPYRAFLSSLNRMSVVTVQTFIQGLADMLTNNTDILVYQPARADIISGSSLWSWGCSKPNIVTVKDILATIGRWSMSFPVLERHTATKERIAWRRYDEGIWKSYDERVLGSYSTDLLIGNPKITLVNQVSSATAGPDDGPIHYIDFSEDLLGLYKPDLSDIATAYSNYINNSIVGFPQQISVQTYGDLIVRLGDITNYGPVFKRTFSGEKKFRDTFDFSLTWNSQPPSTVNAAETATVLSLDADNKLVSKAAYMDDGVSVALKDGVITTSDNELKEDVQKLDIARTLAFIKDLNPVQYHLVKADHKNARLHHGLIAQEVKEAMGEDDWGVYCEVEKTEYKDGQMVPTGETIKALRYDEIIPDLIAVIQYLLEVISDETTDI